MNPFPNSMRGLSYIARSIFMHWQRNRVLNVQSACACSARPAKVRRKRSKAHSPSRPPMGAWGRPMGALWVLLRFRLTLAGRALQIHALFAELVLRSGGKVKTIVGAVLAP